MLERRIFIFIFCWISINADNVPIWKFRENNLPNEKAHAYYSDEILKTKLEDFTLCFRYKLLYFNKGGLGVTIFRYKNIS